MKSVYADHNSTSPSTADHNRKVLALLEKAYANPSSIHHSGREAKRLLEEARENLAAIFGAEKGRILFTSGATEANNFVIQGVVHERFFKSQTKVKVLLSAGEHASVYQPAEALEKRGLCTVSYAPLNKDGVLDKNTFFSLLEQENWDLLCLIHVNNETGAINPLLELLPQIRKRLPKVHIHIDAVQSFGKIDLRWMGASAVDTASASAHKIGGFKGVACLYHKKHVNMLPLFYGGGQERGWRAGTENLAGILSFGLRAQELSQETWVQGLYALRAYFLEGLKAIPAVCIHGSPDLCLPNTINFHVEEVRGEELLLSFEAAGICVSNGSACSSGGGRPSSVLKAMGYTDELATHSVRVSLGKGSTQADLDLILKTLLDLVRWKSRS